MRMLAIIVGAASLAACSTPICKDCGDTGGETVADTDADSDTDADTDPTATTADTGETVPLAGWGVLTGTCGELDDGEWLSSTPALFRNSLDLTGLTWDPTAMQLSPGGQQIYDEGTLGGSSGESEAIAFDMLYRCELATVLLTETTIVYLDEGGKKTDILTGIDGRNIGVSVTRAMTYIDPTDRCGPPDPIAIAELISGKLEDLPLSESNADPANPWERSMLSVVACDDAHADEVEAAWAAAGPTVQGDALLLLTVTEGEDTFLYD